MKKNPFYFCFFKIIIFLMTSAPTFPPLYQPLILSELCYKQNSQTDEQMKSEFTAIPPPPHPQTGA